MRLTKTTALRFCVLTLVTLSLGAAARTPTVVYLDKEELFAVTPGAVPVSVLKSTEHVQSFAVSPSGKAIAFVIGRTDDIGGELRLLDLRTRTLTTLSKPVPSDRDSTRVYANPDFSPSGSELAYLVRTQWPEGSASNDIVMTSGPVAVRPVIGGAERVLDSTAELDLSAVRWSPDGMRLLGSSYAVGAIVDPSGKTLLNLDFVIKSPAFEMPIHALEWLDENCVVVAHEDSGTHRIRMYRLNLANHELVPDTMQLPDDMRSGFPTFEAAGRYVLIGVKGDYRLIDVKAQTVVGRFKATAAHISRLPPDRWMSCTAR